MERQKRCAVTRQPIRVLIVDDEPALREALRELLEEHGVDVIAEASTGTDGVSLALDLRPDVVLMDMRMPGMDGIDATTQIKQRLPKTPVIVQTAYEDPSLEVRARDAGANAYVVKGTPPARILSLLDDLTTGANER